MVFDAKHILRVWCPLCPVSLYCYTFIVFPILSILLLDNFVLLFSFWGWT